MRALPPLNLKDKYYSAIEAEIRRMLDDMIYRPILEIIGLRKQDINREIKNSRSVLLEAMAQGIIWYDNGQFHGRFSAKTSAAIIKLGGVFNVHARTFSLPAAKLPTDLKFAQTAANSRYELMRGRILSLLDNVNPETIDLISKTKEQYEKTLASMDSDFQKTLPKDFKALSEEIAWAFDDSPKKALSSIIIEAKLTEAQKKIIADDWGNNLNLYIKKWTGDNILKLRQEIQPHVLAGGRAEGLIKVIQDNYGVSTRKAKFLARQETALLMSKFQETRYKDIGINRYRWSTAHDKRVRHDHNELHGKIFRFDSPPVTNKKTGARNNPGQDYNCRCVAIALVE